jgi:hypothetical protein
LVGVPVGDALPGGTVADRVTGTDVEFATVTVVWEVAGTLLPQALTSNTVTQAVVAVNQVRAAMSCTPRAR